MIINLPKTFGNSIHFNRISGYKFYTIKKILFQNNTFKKNFDQK